RVGLEEAAIAGLALVGGHVADAGLVRVEAGHEAGPARAAAGGVVELGEAQAVLGQGVEVGGADLAAVTAEVGVAEVVGEDEKDVGPAGGGWFGGLGPGAGQGGEASQKPTAG